MTLLTKYIKLRSEFIEQLKNYGELKRPIEIQITYDGFVCCKELLKIDDGVVYYDNKDTEQLELLTMDELYSIYKQLYKKH